MGSDGTRPSCPWRGRCSTRSQPRPSRTPAPRFRGTLPQRQHRTAALPDHPRGPAEHQLPSPGPDRSAPGCYSRRVGLPTDLGLSSDRCATCWRSRFHWHRKPSASRWSRARTRRPTPRAAPPARAASGYPSRVLAVRHRTYVQCSARTAGPPPVGKSGSPGCHSVTHSSEPGRRAVKRQGVSDDRYCQIR